MSISKAKLNKYVKAISKSGLAIYDPVEVGDPNLWIPSPELEVILNKALKGLSLDGLPLRTRSKVVKQKVCEALGYSVPATFEKTQPRFPGQCFDTYIQKSNNLQVWNEELSPVRRYVLIKVSGKDLVEKVKVVTGDMLAILDTTGTLTQKYQARLTLKNKTSELVSTSDTDRMKIMINTFDTKIKLSDPTDHANSKTLIPIEILYRRLIKILGKTFVDSRHVQERNRGSLLHKLACQALGYKKYKDNGQFPDIPNQLLEIKLQTSPTIDLGLVTPDSKDPLDTPKINGKQIRHCDVRYAIFSANLKGGKIIITNLFLVTGKDFFSRFPRFEGKVINKKLQIPLPADFF
ncbi:MAG TPA: restriction endonuclease [Candidatus Paceibacterota bacterium]|nr:restriction endonuclease [Candidatus Paceibacterota bacterium]